MQTQGIISKLLGGGFIGSLMFGVAVFGICYHYSGRFLDWLRFQSIGTRDYVVERLNIMFIDLPPQKILLYMFIISFGSGFFTFLMFLPQLFPAFLFGTVVTIVGWKAPKPIVDIIYDRRVKKFTVQMVDGLGLMANGMKSGLSVVQAMSLVTQELPNPIKQEFGLVLSENKLGVSLEDAFNNLARRVRSDDVEMFVTSVNILKETGGNLAETFDTIVITLRERIKMQQKIEAMTAQGKYQGYIVAAVPPILGFVFYQADPEFMKPLFTTWMGWVIMLGILALEIVGFFVIMKLVKIDV